MPLAVALCDESTVATLCDDSTEVPAACADWKKPAVITAIAVAPIATHGYLKALVMSNLLVIGCMT